MTADGLALVTGASGGIGAAVARRLGSSHRLVLTDIAAGPLDALAATLRGEGHSVSLAVAGDIAAPGFADTLVAQARAYGRLRSIVHAAGLSPALAGWRPILSANLVGTARLLAAIERGGPDAGCAAVLIASMAGHVARADAASDALLADPLADGFLDAAAVDLARRAASDDPRDWASLAYGLSKRAVIAVARARGGAWGRTGARINSLSPGMIDTPMGQRELAAAGDGARNLLAATPLARIGTPDDIAAAAAFLCSDAASFITATDLLVDGGATPALSARLTN